MSEQDPLPPASSRAYLRVVLAAGTDAEDAWRTAHLLDQLALVRLDVLSDEEVAKIARELGRLVVGVEAEARETERPSGGLHDPVGEG